MPFSNLYYLLSPPLVTAAEIRSMDRHIVRRLSAVKHFVKIFSCPRFGEGAEDIYIVCGAAMEKRGFVKR